MATPKLDELRTIAHRAMAQSASPFLRYQRHGRHQERDGVAFTRQDYAGPGFNFAAVLGPAPPLDAILEVCRDFFSGCTGGYGILVEADAGHRVEAEVRARGWAVAEDEPALVMPEMAAISPAPAGLEIRHLTDPAELPDFSSVLNAAFNLPPDLAAQFAPAPATISAPDMAYLVGYCDGRPAATSMFYGPGGYGGVAGVATHPEYRRRGFGRALTWAALQEAAARGYFPGILRAMGDSYLMYRGMGFIHVCNHRTYAVPASGA
jgi:ribosomal protein S18 acetylase RimI-like enzyme